MINWSKSRLPTSAGESIVAAVMATVKRGIDVRQKGVQIIRRRKNNVGEHLLQSVNSALSTSSCKEWSRFIAKVLGTLGLILNLLEVACPAFAVLFANVLG